MFGNRIRTALSNQRLFYLGECKRGRRREIFFLSFFRMTTNSPVDLLGAADASQSLGNACVCLFIPGFPFLCLLCSSLQGFFFSFGSTAGRPFIYELRPCLAADATFGWSTILPARTHTHQSIGTFPCAFLSKACF